MTLTNVRVQWPVGQGGFHTGELMEDQSARVRYAVDCGAMSTYGAARNESIDGYLNWQSDGDELDYLFITHAHDDHLNGVERLLDKANGKKVKVIVMPLLNVVDRLISYARSASFDPTAATSGFYRDFIVDPVAAVSRFGPEQIIQVRSSGEGGAPFSGPDGGQPPDDPFGRSNLVRPRMPLKMVGQGKVVRGKSSAAKPKNSETAVKSQVWVADDSLGLVYSSGITGARWLLAPYVDPVVESDAGLFMAALAEERKTTVAHLQEWLKKTSNLKSLLTSGLPQLVAAYHAVNKDLNVTSLSLYSGPVPSDVTKMPMPQVHLEFGTVSFSCVSGRRRLGWLGTGDAALKESSRRTAFFDHYGALVSQVHTFMLPHHGSEGNFHVELLHEIAPSLCIAAADKFHKWRHPGTAVVQAVASEGHFLCVVTASKLSRVLEVASIG